LDKEVVGTNGWKIGKSKELIIDNNNWSITHLEVELRSNIEAELGMPTAPLSHNRLPIPISTVQGVGDVITLRTTKEEIVSSLSAYTRTAQTTQRPAGTVTVPGQPPATAPPAP
jgi:sporulation protein YlmC with PRC-barrel domain